MGRSPFHTYSMSAGQRSRWTPEAQLASARRRLERAVQDGEPVTEIERLEARVRKLEARIEAAGDDPDDERAGPEADEKPAPVVPWWEEPGG